MELIKRVCGVQLTHHHIIHSIVTEEDTDDETMNCVDFLRFIAEQQQQGDSNDGVRRSVPTGSFISAVSALIGFERVASFTGIV